jgi:medium-chain acyl-[acyl-carrier-protein] hydrolase
MNSGAGDQRWLVPPIGPATAKLRLFCFPPAGSGAAAFRLWPALLSPAVDVYRVQPPGREMRFREPLIGSMSEYLDAMLPAILPSLEGRFAFFGHSMGSLVAFNVARRLRRDCKRLPQHLFVSAFRSPQAPPMKRIHELADGDFVHELRETYDGIPDQLLHEPEVLSLMLPIIRADLAVASSDRYIAESPLECPVTAFGGLGDRWVDEQQLAEWCVQTSARFDLQMFPGNHYYLASATEALMSAIRGSLKSSVRSAAVTG